MGSLFSVLFFKNSPVCATLIEDFSKKEEDYTAPMRKLVDFVSAHATVVKCQISLPTLKVVETSRVDKSGP